MDIAVSDKSQSKKVFRARKTMKMSDRQQLESIHNSHSSSELPSSSSTSSSLPPSPIVMNGKYKEEEQMETENGRESHTDKNPKETRSTPPVSRSPSPLTLSLSLSPSPSSKTPELGSNCNVLSTSARSPNSVGKESDTKRGDNKEGINESSLMVEGETTDDKKEEEREGTAGLGVKDKEDDNPKPDDLSSSLDSLQDPTISPVSPLASERKEEENQNENDDRTGSVEAVAMDTDSALMDTKVLEVNKPSPAVDTTSSSSPCFSPSHAPESDQEVKEGFLVLSEEDENQGERDEEKEEKDKGGVTEDERGECMEVTTEKKDVGITAQSSSPPSPTSSPAPLASGDKGVDKCSSTPFGKKRALSGDTEMDEQKKKDEEEGVMREGKRQKVEEEELEAQMELKIRADTRSRLKLEKVVQKLVEEQLRVLQLSVFDRSLQELRERVEKIDCATKHQQTLNTLQAKIARLAKKFGAANQAKDNTRKPQEALSSSAASTTPTLTAGATSTLRPVRTTVETNTQTNQNMTPRPLATTVSLAQPKPLSTSTPPVSAPILFTTSASLDTTSTLSSQNQMGTLLLQTTPANNAATPSNPSPAPQPLSLQPLLIQLPISVTNTQGAAAMTNSPAGVGLMPVSSLGTVTMPSKAKTTTTAATFILQKPSPSSSALSLPSSPSLPQMTLARAVYPGGSAAVGVPSSGVSVTSARTPTQCVSVAGLTSSSSSLPKSSAPAATGGQPAGPAASGTPSATVMASKTDNQATNSAASKPTVQVPRTGKSGSVIDLTEDDDDVQVTGVQKAPVQSGSLSSSASTVTQRTTGASPALLSSNTRHGPATGSTMRSSPQTGLHSVNGPVIVPCRSPQNSPSKIRSANPNPPPHQFPPLPSLPPPPPRLPPEAGNTSVPQQPQLRLARVQSQNGIVLSWCVEEVDCTCAAVDSYHLYAYHQDQAGPSHWKKIGEVKALPLPMACTLTQFVSGSTYYFAVCARDIYSRYGPFCEPQCTDVINLSSSS